MIKIEMNKYLKISLMAQYAIWFLHYVDKKCIFSSEYKYLCLEFMKMGGIPAVFGRIQESVTARLAYGPLIDTWNMHRSDPSNSSIYLIIELCCILCPLP